MDKEKEYLKRLGANIQRRRLILGWEVGDVASRLGIKRGTYSKLEKGLARMTDELFASISDLFKMSAAVLLAEQPKCEYRFFRKNARQTKRETALIEQATLDGIRKLKDYVSLEDWLGEKCEFDGLLKKDFARGANESIEKFAMRVRKGLRDRGWEANENLAEILEKYGVKIFAIPLPVANCFGFSFCSEGKCGILINNDPQIPVERQLFTLAHELGHILLHGDGDFVNVAEDDVKKKESEAQKFAGRLLLPDDEFFTAWQACAGMSWVERVMAVKRRFRVSYKTILYRLSEGKGRKESGTMFAVFPRAYEQRYGQKLSGKMEPQPYPFSAFESQRFSLLALEAFKRGEITMSRLAELLERDLFETREIVNAAYGKVG